MKLAKFWLGKEAIRECTSKEKAANVLDIRQQVFSFTGNIRLECLKTQAPKLSNPISNNEEAKAKISFALPFLTELASWTYNEVDDVC